MAESTLHRARTKACQRLAAVLTALLLILCTAGFLPETAAYASGLDMYAGSDTYVVSDHDIASDACTSMSDTYIKKEVYTSDSGASEADSEAAAVNDEAVNDEAVNDDAAAGVDTAASQSEDASAYGEDTAADGAAVGTIYGSEDGTAAYSTDGVTSRSINGGAAYGSDTTDAEISKDAATEGATASDALENGSAQVSVSVIQELGEGEVPLAQIDADPQGHGLPGAPGSDRCGVHIVLLIAAVLTAVCMAAEIHRQLAIEDTLKNELSIETRRQIRLNRYRAVQKEGGAVR